MSEMSSNATASPSVHQPARPQAYDRPSYNNTMFTGSRIIINDGRFVQTNSAPAENRGFSLLTDAASPLAFHNAYHFSLPLSHSNTQAAALDRIKGWISDNKADPVMWLYGPEGAGKSSLAQSIAVWCEQESLLLASFFFSRSDPSRNNTHHFIPTLAYSIIQVIPESRHMIEQAVNSDPHIFSRSLDAQISRLVFHPLSTLAQKSTLNGSRPFPHVLVVDGLDECQDEIAQKSILRIFTGSPGFGSWNPGWKVLITSRPEQAIRIKFDSMRVSTRLALSKGSPANTSPLLNTKDIPSAGGDLLGVPVTPRPPEQNIIPSVLTSVMAQAPLWDQEVVPALRKRLQSEAANLARRSAIPLPSDPSSTLPEQNSDSLRDAHRFRRSPYYGPRRKLVLAFDVGTKFSRVSYSIFTPGDVPHVWPVTRFPGHEHISGASKIPSIIYYDRSGRVRAVGAEATTKNTCELAVEEDWIKSQWFKLHLKSKAKDRDIPPLPPNKSAAEVFANFLEYLFQCARDYIKETHPNGPSLWESIKNNIDFVLSHSNSNLWLQQEMIRAAVLAKLIPDTTGGHARLKLVTEGEAGLHFSIENGFPIGAMKSGDGVVIVDAGEGTIDISFHCRMSSGKGGFEEAAAPQSLFNGFVFVKLRAREFLHKFLTGSAFFDDLDHMMDCFDKTTKLRFRNSEEPQYLKFGSTRDNDAAYNIRFGQLKLQGSDVAMFFKPSIDCIVEAVLNQRKLTPISHVVLLGSFSTSDWFYNSVQVQLEKQGLGVSRPDNHVAKAVSDGAILFYLHAGFA